MISSDEDAYGEDEEYEVEDSEEEELHSCGIQKDKTKMIKSPQIDALHSSSSATQMWS